jgi:hypothetical protein
MLCAELEQLEGQLDEIIIALENPELTPEERTDLERTHARLSKAITAHQRAGHEGGPCFEE